MRAFSGDVASGRMRLRSDYLPNEEFKLNGHRIKFYQAGKRLSRRK
jgi:hypothetical protein